MKKEFCINQLVAVCVKKNCTPKKTGFCDLILRLCATYYGYERRTAKKYVDILIQSFNFDRWKTLVQQNTFLKEEEKNEWTKTL